MRVDWLSLNPRLEHPDMAALDFQERRLRSRLTDAYPEQIASAALHERVGLLAMESAGAPIRLPALRIGVGLAVLAAVLRALVSLGHPWVGAAVIGHARLALQGVTRLESVTWSVEPGSERTMTSESWYQDGSWRIDEPPHFELFTHGRVLSYKGAPVLAAFRAPSPFFHLASSGFSITAIGAAMSSWGWDRIQFLGVSTLDGRQVNRVAILQPEEDSRTLLLVDRVTYLPVQSLIQVDRDGVWTTASITHLWYPATPIPGSRFKPVSRGATSAPKIDAAEAARLREMSPGLAHRVIGHRKIVVRDLTVNGAGMVVAIYTTGRRPGDARPPIEARLSDSRGTAYSASQASIARGAGNNAIRSQGGDELEEQFWFPLTSSPVDSKRPLRYTLTFHVPLSGKRGQDVQITLPASRVNSGAALSISRVKVYPGPKAPDLAAAS